MKHPYFVDRKLIFNWWIFQPVVPVSGGVIFWRVSFKAAPSSLAKLLQNGQPHRYLNVHVRVLSIWWSNFHKVLFVVQQIKMYINVSNIYEGLDAYSTCILYIAYNTYMYIFIYYNNQLDMWHKSLYGLPSHVVSTFLLANISFLITWYLMTGRGRHICTNLASLVTKLPMHGLLCSYPTPT